MFIIMTQKKLDRMLKDANDRGLRNLRLAQALQRGSILAGYDLDKDLAEIQKGKVNY